MGIEVIGVDIYPKEWIATSSDVNYFHQIPPTSDSRRYKIKILELCQHYRVKIVIPLTDVEVDYFSDNREEFENKGIVVGISKKNVVRFLRNKLKLFEAFSESKINVIPTYTKETYVKKCNIFPCVAKRITGRSSEGMFILHEERDLDRSELEKHSYIFQPFVRGEIIVVDLLKSHDQKVIYIARRELTRTKNGAGIAVEIIEEKKLKSVIEYFCSAVDFDGCINIEFIKNNSKYYLMDINPRFSAGVVFSNIAGYNFVKNHIMHFLNKDVERLGKVKYGIIITRKYVELIV
jgi:carbamoyl-phosphate synthase large subunit